MPTCRGRLALAASFARFQNDFGALSHYHELATYLD
jgi:hypothetical protein